MKNFPILSTLIIALLSFTACQSNTNQPAQNTTDGKVSISIFKTKLSTVSAPQLIDVRTPEEFNNGTLTGAINMNYRAENIDNQLNTLDKSKPVFIFCQSGGRSGKCYKKMKNLGFSEVYDMEGGYGSWSNQ